MTKVKANALWNKLSVGQRETLDKWVFEERLSYVAAWPRAKAELGFKGSKASLQRYFTRRQRERVTTEFTELRDELAAISSAPTDAAALWAASKKLQGRYLFQRLREAPDNVKEWAPVAQLMAQNDYNELLRESKAEEHKIRREAMEFAKEKFEFETMERALKALPELRELAEAKKDPQTRRYEENIRWNRVRRAMFGIGREVQPESAQEEAEMIAAKKEREERQEREAQMEQERIIGVQPPTPSSGYYAEYMEKQAEWERKEKLQTPSSQAPEKLQASSSNEGEHGGNEDEKEGKGAGPRKYSKQYQEYLDKLKQWEENRVVLGWEDVPRPEWSGRWPMMKEQ